MKLENSSPFRIQRFMMPVGKIGDWGFFYPLSVLNIRMNRYVLLIADIVI